MKLCPQCKRKNNDEATSCAGCATLLEKGTNKMNSQQIAEALARKCVTELNPSFGIGREDTYTINRLTNQILQSIPLVELLECALQLKDVAAKQGYIPYEFAALTTKLTQLGIEV